MIFAIKWIAIGAILLADIVWAYVAGIRLSWPMVSLIVFTGAVAILYSTLRPNELIASLFWATTEVLASLNVVGVLSYLCFSSNPVAVDASLSAIDQLFGFHWLAWKQAIDRHSLMNAVLSFGYWSINAQILITLVFFSASNRIERLQEFSFVFVVVLVACAAISVVFPSDSACSLYGVDLEACRLDTIRDLRAMRFSEITFGATKGIITFPSFHAAVALMLIWACRGIRFLFPISLALNSLMFLATPTIGGHYLVDVIVGTLLMLVAASLYSKLLSYQRRKSEHEQARVQRAAAPCE